jgi:branched-chain amino acid transport system ATP-binding protein
LIERLYDHFPRLAERRKQEAVTMSGGEQQMLAVASALARDVKLPPPHEPYEGLAPVIVSLKSRRFLKRSKVSCFLQPSSSSKTRSPPCIFPDRALILDMGEIVFDGTAKEVIDNAELRQQQYLAI